MLLAARVVQASGTAIMMPLLMTTVMTLVPPTRRGVMMGNISIVIAVAPAIGPAVSGLVLSLLGWRFLFWLVLPIALVSLAVGLRRITNVGEPTAMRIDVLSVVLSAFGFGGLVYGLSSFGQGTAGPSTTTWVAFVVGAVGLAAFVGRQLVLQRDDRALLDLRTFRFRTFTTSSVLMMLMMAVLLGAIVLLPIYMQTVQGLAPLTTGLLLLPGGLLMGLLGPVVGRLYDRFGARALLLPGTVVTSLALWSATLLGVHSPAAQILVFHLLLCAGLAFVFTPLFTAGSGRPAGAPLLLRQRGLRCDAAAGGRGGRGAAGERVQRAVGGARRFRRGRGRRHRGRGACRVRRGGVPVAGSDRRRPVRPHARSRRVLPPGTDIVLPTAVLSQ